MEEMMSYYTRDDYDVHKDKHGKFLITEGGCVLDDERFDCADDAIEYLDDMLNCQLCEGAGTLPCRTCNERGYVWNKGKEVYCPTCRGKREIQCYRCHGTGNEQ
jgi:hypothetical protein